jgi:hypothetical protein
MAKAKKSETEASDAGATKKQAPESKKAATGTKAQASEPSPAKPAAATKKKAVGKPALGGAGSATPLIDTSLAAQAAARMLLSRATTGGAVAQPQAAEANPQGAQGETPEKRETSTFKQLKNSLNKPTSGSLGSVLGGGMSGKKGNTGFGSGNRQVGRNQTFGADVNRSGVPRRTGG